MNLHSKIIDTIENFDSHPTPNLLSDPCFEPSVSLEGIYSSHRQTSNLLQQLEEKDIEIKAKNKKLSELESTLRNAESRCNDLIQDSEDLGFIAEEKEEVEKKLENREAHINHLNIWIRGLKRHSTICERDLRLMRKQNAELQKTTRRQAQSLQFRCTHIQRDIQLQCSHLMCHACELNLRLSPNPVCPECSRSLEETQVELV